MPPAGEYTGTAPWKMILVVALLFIGILIAGALFYTSQEQEIKDQVTGDLTTITLLKTDQIATWRGERLGDGAVLSRNPILIRRVNDYLTSPDPAGREDLLSLFGQINASYDYHNVQLLDSHGKVVLSLDPEETTTSPGLEEQVTGSLATGQVTLSDLTFGTDQRTPEMYVIAPLIAADTGGTGAVGVIILTIDPAIRLYPLIRSWPVPSESAETLLVRKDGEHVLFLNDLRHQPGTALNLTIPLTQSDVPAVMAVLGTKGAFAGKDYRGNDVISVLEPVPGSPWYMVAKVDTAEAYAPWRTRSGLIIALVVGTLAGAIVLAGLLWQRRQKYFYRSLFAAEAARREYEEQDRERMGVLLRLSEMTGAGEQELADFVLDAGCRLTESSLAFIGTMTPDESVFDITSWSKSAMKDCSVAASPIHYPIDKAGIWAEAVRQKKPIIVNDYPAPQPGKKGLPPGHVPVSRFISVPIFDEQRIVMVSAVANKDTDYTALDVDNLTLLMQGVWSHIRKRRADDALRQKTMDLEAAFEEITATDEELRSNYEEIARTQRALAESERKYRNLYQYAQVGLFETSFVDATIVACNQRYADLAGFPSVEEAIGKDVLHLYVHAEDRTEVARVLKEQGYIENQTLELRNQRTGKIFWAQFSARYNYERNVAEGSIIDITEQKEAENLLRENENRLLMAQEIGHIGGWEYNLETGKIWGSAEGARIYGLARGAGDFPLDEIEACIPERERVHQALADLIQAEKEYNLEFAINPADGSPQKVIMSVARLEKDAQGNPVRVVGVIQDITDRKRAEDELRESEERFRGVFEYSTAGKSLTAPDGRLLRVNRAFADMLGYMLDEMQHTDFMKITHPDDLAESRECVRTLLAGEAASYRMEKRYLHKNGKIVWADVSTSLLRDVNGKPLYLMTTILDITGRMKAEESLRETNEYLQNLFDYANAPIIVWDPQFRITRFNHAFERLTGRKEKEVTGQHLEILFPEASREASLEQIRKTGTGERWETVEIPILHISGEIRIVLWNSANIVDIKGALISTIAQGYDITDRKAALDALRQSEEKYRVLFTRMTEGSALHEIVYDMNGNPVDYRILDVNPAFETVLGIRREDVVGKTSCEAYGFATPPFLDTYAEVAATGQPALFEEFFAPMNKHFSISVFSPEKGRFATVFEDITERKQAEELRERLITELEQKNAELERFTYTVSHDLKSPLITIRGFAGMIDDDYLKGDPVQLKKDVSRIITAADTMQVLLSDLLELARVGKISNPPQKIAFGTIAREAVDLLAGPLAEKGITVEIAPDLPVVYVDHARIREVMVNLLENAVKFSGNRPEPVIRIGADTGGVDPVFFVADNGIGINPRYLDRIFNLFERLDVTAHGTGIGLTIVRRIIEVHGGKVWAESDGVGKGTTFRFTLPGAPENE